MGRISARVMLIRSTPQPAEIISSAAKLCYASKTDGILDQDAGKACSFVNRLLQLGHMSPIEHAVFTFYIEGISRAVTHQLVRHRIASYSQRSQRYVNHDSFDYVVPPQLEGRVVEIDGLEYDAVDYYEQTMHIIAERYTRLNEALGSQGEGSNEDARYVLPNACETKIFVTMNARELLHFFEQRLCMRAQWEIRDVAVKMLRLAKEACPPVFDGAGPKCIRNKGCPEGIMSCGLYDEMKERYAVKQ